CGGGDSSAGRSCGRLAVRTATPSSPAPGPRLAEAVASLQSRRTGARAARVSDPASVDPDSPAAARLVPPSVLASSCFPSWQSNHGALALPVRGPGPFCRPYSSPFLALPAPGEGPGGEGATGGG
ncbi:hypothetical protein THAOC_27208, partial [Thalassiosira oceanica]